MKLRPIAPADSVWLLLESRDTPMHFGGLLEFTLPPDAPPGFLATMVSAMRDHPGPAVAPWNLKPAAGALPLLVEEEDIDLDYHVRHSALPAPGGQRELGVLISRLHSHQLDLRRPLWELHLIEGLAGGRFALYLKVHHALLDGVGGVRTVLRTFATDPADRGRPPFWAARRERRPATPTPRTSDLVRSVAGAPRAIASVTKGALDLGHSAIVKRPLRAPYTSPQSPLRAQLTGQRRFATQSYELDRITAIANDAGCTINDVVLYLTSTALRRYLVEHVTLPDRPLTAGIPVNVRDPSDRGDGNSISLIIADLATDVDDPLRRLEKIRASTAAAKRHLRALPTQAHVPYLFAVNGAYVGTLTMGLGRRSLVPFSVAVSNVPGPSERLYLDGARLETVFPVAPLLHGGALNVTCISYAGMLSFGLTGARDTLPHLQRLAVHMGEALDELGAYAAPTT